METAATVIADALQELVIQASESPIQQDEAQTAIRYMNRMMNKFAADGINLGYTVVSDLGDEITVPAGAIDGMVSNLAVALGPQYEVPINISLAQRARDGLATMRKLSVTIAPTRYPNTLPLGSGNEEDFGVCQDHFYGDTRDPVLTEQGGFISIESETDLP